jgi:cobalt/nickel transport system permease protein
LAFAIGDPYQKRVTAVHRLDPRIKLVVALLFIVLVNLLPVGHWWSYLAFWLVVVLVSCLARLGPLYTVRKSLFATPFILAALSIPFTTQGAAVLTIPWLGWVMTDKGIQLLFSVLFRFWIAVQTAVLLVAVTRIPDLLWALRTLRIPAVLVSIIAVMYRYLRVLGSEANRMLRARTARSCRVKGNRSPSLIWRVRVTGTMIGSLFLRAVERSERIHLAMLSRGYDGSPRSLVSFHLGYIDWLTLFGSLFLALICFVWVLL